MGKPHTMVVTDLTEKQWRAFRVWLAKNGCTGSFWLASKIKEQLGE